MQTTRRGALTTNNALFLTDPGTDSARCARREAEEPRHLSGTLGGYRHAAERVERIDEGGQAEAARSMLGSLAEAPGITRNT
ncbi:hypothetical protein ABZ805_00745 [Saccharopolyspora sp. NPDC047091]|uniref:hypothetical protein n=1 Tax=Saccharopolyspora sp. NPDC047091 TaxID=3155924 RepID=UPI003401086C